MTMRPLASTGAVPGISLQSAPGGRDWADAAALSMARKNAGMVLDRRRGMGVSVLTCQ
jgi:hypothetical protein